MANFNKVFLMGNLTRDPELRYAGGAAGGGSAICKFGLAVNRQWRDQAGQLQEEVTYVDITVFSRQAETCNEYLKKGRPVFIEGRLNFSQWEDRETKQKRSKLDVVGERVQFLGAGGGRGGEGGGGGGGGGGYRQQRDAGGASSDSTAQSHQPRSPAPAPAKPAPAAEGVDFDDIPF